MSERRLNRILISYLAPASVFLMLTGMLWLDERGNYPKLFYLGIICAFWLQFASREWPREFLAQPIIQFFLLFAAYFSLSLLWLDEGDQAVLSALKRPVLILLLFLLFFELGRQRFNSLRTAVSVAAVFAVLAAVVEIAIFLRNGGEGRLASNGALSNPLLISHVYGFFTALWLAASVSTNRSKLVVSNLLATLILLALLVLTGSRTPLVAFFAAMVWLFIVHDSRVARGFAFASIVGGTVIYLLLPELLTSRGLSYRPEIWQIVLGEIGERPWLGHGLGAPLSVYIQELGFPLSDPHNMTLSVLFQGGMIGFVIWLGLYGSAFLLSWKHRASRDVVIASAAAVYGLFAGMTEGGAILSRPKEHWFLVWIPLALLTAALYQARTRNQKNA